MGCKYTKDDLFDMPVLIGTSGWQYKSWKQRFYPSNIAQHDWLYFYVSHFQTVEINNSFYRLPSEDIFSKWAMSAPDDFIFSPKMSRYLTHLKKLKDPQEAIFRFLNNTKALGEKMGPILIQLPPNLEIKLKALDESLSCFPSSVKVAVEFRHPSWFVLETKSILEKYGAALCLADKKGIITPIWKTTNWSYIRFHFGNSSSYSGCYKRKDLDRWAQLVGQNWTKDETVYAYFNNDPLGCAIRDARWFSQSLQKIGLMPSRVPKASDIKMNPINIK